MIYEDCDLDVQGVFTKFLKIYITNTPDHCGIKASFGVSPWKSA